VIRTSKTSDCPHYAIATWDVLDSLKRRYPHSGIMLFAIPLSCGGVTGGMRRVESTAREWRRTTSGTGEANAACGITGAIIF
jgi:hypothetical protein